MGELFIVTGASGHLGNTIVRKLIAEGLRVRALVLPTESERALEGLNVETVMGDVRDRDSLAPLFSADEQDEMIVIHAAGVVSIDSGYNRLVYDVNVNGTENVVQMCLEHRVKRLVYVSSVHAIPEKPKGEVISEVNEFNTDGLVGLYAKTKAEATRIVLNGVLKGLDAVVVHPSGIIGPGDYGRGHSTQLVMDYVDGRLTAGVAGGYDFVDVRDVADGIIAAARKGRSGECYILANEYVSVERLMAELGKATGRCRKSTMLPLWFAKLTAPLAELYYHLLRQPPLYTWYSLYTLQSNANFSHKKAERELAFKPRPLKQTIDDTIKWLAEQGRVKRIRRDDRA